MSAAIGQASPDKGAAPGLDLQLMRLALQQAERALELGEVPVGAVVSVPLACLEAAGADPAAFELLAPGVWLLGVGANTTRAEHRVNAHAELVALEQASRKLEDFRLEGASVHVTLEPCLMCLGALQQARISRVVYGAHEPKFGALGSRYDLAGHEALRRMTFEGGVLADEASTLMARFFAGLRGRSGPVGQP